MGRFYFNCVLVLSLLTSATSLFAQASKFEKPSRFKDLQTLYTYQKSNWDGSHASTIFLYIKDSANLESFKWAAGDKWATLVSAQADWKNYSIKSFINHRVYAGGERKLIAQLESDGKGIHWVVNGIADSMVLDDAHWQSYDFDFAGLGFTWRALKDKKSSFTFHIADVGMVNNKVAFINKGQVKVDYLGTEMQNGKECLKYKIDGEGLENRGGHIWINPETFMIELYRIALPDEEGFVNGQLKLLKTEKLTPVEWERFINSKMAGGK